MTPPKVSPDHPTIPLLFCLDDRLDDFAVERMHRLVDELASSHTWTVSPPTFIDETEEPDHPDHAPIRTVGGVLDLYSGFPPWGDRLPLDVDRAQLADVALLVERLRVLSAELQTEIALEYNGESIGWIDRDGPDNNVAEGLIGAWERAVDRRKE